MVGSTLGEGLMVMAEERKAWIGDRLGPFAAVKWKAIRAQQLADKIDTLISNFGSEAFLELSTEKTGEWIEVSVRSVRPLPAEVSLSVSEACHHLRSSLDHIAWEISSKPEDRALRNKVKFPIETDRARFEGNQPRNLLGADQMAVDIVRRYQPFNNVQSPKNSLLEKLQAVSNWDKHQELLAGVVAISGSSIFYTYRGATVHTETLEDTVLTETGIKLGAFPWEDTWDAKGVSFVPRIRLRSAFHSGMPDVVRGTDIVSFLSETSAYINNEILNDFSAFLR